MKPEIRLINTLTGRKEPLVTRQPGKLTMYSCGPTVYGLIHIGNLRAGLVADLICRYFRYAGYDVTYVRNYTDVDDKIIQAAAKEGISTEELTRRYVTEVEKDYAVAGMLDPTHKTKATEHIPEMIAMIQKMIDRKRAYVVPAAEGEAVGAKEVLFAIDQFPGYGKLSHKKIDDLIAGVRIEVDARKKNPLDFALWKPAKPGEPSWDSPWGKGRPGWHIECSAMACKWLGEQIDVHHGGVDLIFPHHENEIAQSETATGKDPFVKYWLHNAHLTISREKMSKSVGNVFLAREFLTRYSGEVARYLLLSVHYRASIDFSEESIGNALQALHRLYEAKLKAVELTQKRTALPDQRAETLWGTFAADCEKRISEIQEFLANDLNTAGALGALFSLIREFNRVLSEPRAEATPGASLGAQLLIQAIEQHIGATIGVGLLAPQKALADLARVKGLTSAAGSGGSDRISGEEIERLIAERAAARKNKDFERGDAIRKELEARGVLIKDGPSGTSWTYR